MKSITRFVDIHNCEYDGEVFRSKENSRTIKMFHLQMFACPNISRNFYEDHKLFCDVMSFMLYLQSS